MKQLKLDDLSIDTSELTTYALNREFSQQSRPNWLLRWMMNHIESRWQETGYGWSREWNKSGLNVFRAHTTCPATDRTLHAPLCTLIQRLIVPLPKEDKDFVEDLLSDPEMTANTFYHNRVEGEDEFEGLTLSLGRKAPGNHARQDRVDLILEDFRVAGAVDGRIDKIRLYISPWSEYQQGRYPMRDISGADLLPERAASQALYREAVLTYHMWKTQEARQWNHWSTRFMDSFGPRAFIPIGSAFT